jgi:hypothetical protein
MTEAKSYPAVLKTLTAGHPQKEKGARAIVKGPIRCHNCQLMCVDAEHYLTHECRMRKQINELHDR